MPGLRVVKKDNWKWTRRTFKLVGGSIAAGLPLAIYAIVAHFTPAPELTECLDALAHNAKAIGTIMGATLAVPVGHGAVGLTKWGIKRYKSKHPHHKQDTPAADIPNNNASQQNTSGT